MKHFSMKQITYTIFLGFCCFTGPVSYAKTPPALSQLIKEATQNNPQIRAARDRLLAAIHVIPQAKALPDPKLNAGTSTCLRISLWMWIQDASKC